MSATVITITGSFPGQAGTVYLTRSGVMVNNLVTYEPTPVIGEIFNGEVLAADRQSPLEYFADNDPGSTTGLHTTIQIMIDGAPVDEFDAVVPYTASGGTIDLDTLRGSELNVD